MKEKIYIGIDVSKAQLDIFISNCKKLRKRNALKDIKQFVKYLQELPVELIVLEATGGYEIMLVSELHSANLPVAVVNPLRTKHFARSLGKNAKNDLLDAEVLCLYAERVNPKRTEPIDDEATELKSLILRREQLTRALTKEKNRLLSPTTTESIQSTIETMITVLKEQIKILNKRIKDKIESNRDFTKKDTLLQGVQGVGPVASATLIALLPELGRINRKEIAALVGVAPFDKDSGLSRGKRSIYGGRATVRNILYMATVTAIRVNPAIKHFYLRLVQAGKANKIAITACMRKLLTALNAMIRDNLEWSNARYMIQA